MSTSAAALSPASPARLPRGLNAALWVVQALLAAMFAFAALPKATAPFAELAAKMPGMAGFPEALVRFIGVAELAGALGLLLPALTRIRPGLTPLAAAGLAVVMALAAGFHALRGEWQSLPVNLVLLGLAAFVAWGRAGRAAIPPRG